MNNNHLHLVAAEVGHPITNALMSQANNADQADSLDTVDAGPFVARFGAGPVLEEEVSGHATVGQADQVDQVAAGDALADQLLEVENLIEGARDAIVRRLEQFDQVDERTARIEEKLDRLLAALGG